MHVYRTPSPYLFREFQPAYWSPAQHEALCLLREQFGATRDLLEPEVIRRLRFVHWALYNGVWGRG